ncbi:hypothetical protein MHU86_7929 [Fragilaria crotonensis]|nr:hypothetical protein MHU86_7929 [Fragilaria crotonensis]
MHRIAASGLVLLVTLTLGTIAQQVDVVADASALTSNLNSAPPAPVSFNEFCDYGETCCPGDGRMRETTCYCDSDFRFSCAYGDAVVCDETEMTFESEQECSCYAGQYICTKNICPEACPATQPIQGETCSPFNGFSCYYDEFCCPDEGGACAPVTTCYCDNGATNCNEDQVWASIPCNSVCPDTPPTSYVDSCDIDSRFKCTYGEPFYCNITDMMHESERECHCANGVFVCYENACPVTCPVVKPVDGDVCSPFIDYYCPYEEFCCPTGDANETCVPDTTCYCEDSVTTCYQGASEGSLPCPSMCPESPPDTFDTCDIDSRFSCVYGDAFVCDEVGWEYEYEKQCVCTDGHFYCTSNACPVACPATQPVEGEACTPFKDYYCSYDEFCCSGDDADVCVPKTECYCNSNMTITCYEPTISCPSVCPVSTPIDNNSSLCTIDERYLCSYENGTCESPYEAGGISCTCTFGLFTCTQQCMGDDFIFFEVIDNGAAGNSDPLETVEEEEENVEPRSITSDEAESKDPSNGKKQMKKKKHANAMRGQTKKDGKARTLLRS